MTDPLTFLTESRIRAEELASRKRKLGELYQLQSARWHRLDDALYSVPRGIGPDEDKPSVLTARLIVAADAILECGMQDAIVNCTPGDNDATRDVRSLFEIALTGDSEKILQAAKVILSNPEGDIRNARLCDFRVAMVVEYQHRCDREIAECFPDLCPAEEQAPAPSVPTEQVGTNALPGQRIVWYHGEQSYSADGCTPVNLSPEQHNILVAFLDRDIALDTAALTKAGANNVTKVVKSIEERFPGTVRRPKNKGEGYFIRVRTKTATK